MSDAPAILGSILFTLVASFVVAMLTHFVLRMAGFDKGRVPVAEDPPEPVKRPVVYESRQAMIEDMLTFTIEDLLEKYGGVFPVIRATEAVRPTEACIKADCPCTKTSSGTISTLREMVGITGVNGSPGVCGGGVTGYQGFHGGAGGAGGASGGAGGDAVGVFGRAVENGLSFDKAMKDVIKSRADGVIMAIIDLLSRR